MKFCDPLSLDLGAAGARNAAFGTCKKHAPTSGTIDIALQASNSNASLEPIVLRLAQREHQAFL